MGSKYRSPEKGLFYGYVPGGSSKPFGGENSSSNENSKPCNESELVIVLKKKVTDFQQRLFESRISRDSALKKKDDIIDELKRTIKKKADSANERVQREKEYQMQKEELSVLKQKLNKCQASWEETKKQLNLEKIKFSDLEKTFSAAEKELISAKVSKKRKRVVEDEVESTPSTSTNNNQSPILQQRKYAKSNRKNTTCTKCSVTFRTRESLIAHRELPACPPVYECSDCDLKFGSKQVRSIHVTMQHSGTVACIPCKLEFENRYLYKYHIHRDHGTPARVQCEHCSLFFGNKKLLAAHQRACKEVKPDAPLVAYTPEERKKFQDEIDSLVVHKRHIDALFPTYKPEFVFYLDETGSIGFRAPIKEDELWYLYYASYTTKTKQKGSHGHFVVSSNLSPFAWYSTQLERSRDARDPVPPKTKRPPHCEHTSKATLQDQKTDWLSVRLVLTCASQPIANNVKYYVNSICKVSNLHGTTAGIHDTLFWKERAEQKVMSMLISNNIPLR